jgi:sporulation protein YlmC with PRC-barrel domain
MRTVAVLAGAALASFLLLTGAAVAQERKGDAKDATVFRSVDLIGKEVRNAKGESIGKVEDYVINLKDGSIVYAALQYGDTLGFGGKMFAIPPSAMKLSDDWKTFVLNVNKEEFDKVQGFDANKWPTAPDNRWGANKDDKTPRAEPPRADAPREGDANLRRLSSLVGLTVKDKDGETVGTCQGAGIDLSQNKVAYMVLAYGGVAGVGSKYFAIPCDAAEMKSFDLKSKPGFVLNAKKADFENSPGFDYKTWPNKPDNRFGKDGKP